MLIVPSEWYEGLPLTVLEAYSNGIPVVASRLGGLGEVVLDGVTGLHVSPGDVVELRQKIAYLIRNQNVANSIGKRCREEYEAKYQPDRNYRALCRIYEQAISAYRAKSRQPRYHRNGRRSNSGGADD